MNQYQIHEKYGSYARTELAFYMLVFGIIGNPVEHSLSPYMHEAAYQALNMNAKYVLFEPDTEGLGDAIAGAAELGIRGLNVTIPFKEEVLRYVDPDPTAERIGAVNTIDFSESPPTGHNTDTAGIERSLNYHSIDVKNSMAIVLGAGGAGRATAFTLADMGAHVHITNRTIERATELADSIPDARSHGLDELPNLLETADLLVNATSVGMQENKSIVSDNLLHQDLVIMDCVYRPVQTRLLREAASQGAQTIDGAWMLLFQGVEAFERWTGQDAPIDVMNKALRNHL